ncbi:MAG: hypothetical protein ACTSUE_14425 [Promethearchaeota archaeon]
MRGRGSSLQDEVTIVLSTVQFAILTSILSVIGIPVTILLVNLGEKRVKESPSRMSNKGERSQNLKPERRNLRVRSQLGA